VISAVEEDAMGPEELEGVQEEEDLVLSM